MSNPKPAIELLSHPAVLLLQSHNANGVMFKTMTPPWTAQQKQRRKFSGWDVDLTWIGHLSHCVMACQTSRVTGFHLPGMEAEVCQTMTQHVWRAVLDDHSPPTGGKGLFTTLQLCFGPNQMRMHVTAPGHNFLDIFDGHCHAPCVSIDWHLWDNAWWVQCNPHIHPHFKCGKPR